MQALSARVCEFLHTYVCHMCVLHVCVMCVFLHSVLIKAPLKIVHHLAQVLKGLMGRLMNIVPSLVVQGRRVFVTLVESMYYFLMDRCCLPPEKHCRVYTLYSVCGGEL